MTHSSVVSAVFQIEGERLNIGVISPSELSLQPKDRRDLISFLGKSGELVLRIDDDEHRSQIKVKAVDNVRGVLFVERKPENHFA